MLKEQAMQQTLEEAYQTKDAQTVAALDILEGRPNQQMEEYVQSRIDLIHIPNRDDAFLRYCLLNMYANPARNQRTAQLLNR